MIAAKLILEDLFMLSMGIDQHRKQLTVHVRDDQGEVVLRRQVSTQWDKVREFLDDLDRRAAPTAGSTGPPLV